jgi:secreted trypsin-like serine protease
MRRLIVRGLALSAEYAPYMTRLVVGSSALCSGSLLTNRSVLTAAHCVYNVSDEPLVVSTYLTDVAAPDEASDVVRVARVAVHPDYRGDARYGQDVAVLTLERAVVGAAQPVALDDGSWWSATPRTNAAYVLGYGVEAVDGAPSASLRAAHVHLYTRAECAARLGVSADSLSCAGWAGADACSGDSGGPLVVAHGGAVVQVGVVSWSTSACGLSPSVYSLVSAARVFLETEAPGVVFASAPPDEPVRVDACECTSARNSSDECTSNGASVPCGCAEHTEEETGSAYCYVKYEGCPDTNHSRVFFGASYRACDAALVPSPSLPPPFPTSPPPSFPPPPPRNSVVALASLIVAVVLTLGVVAWLGKKSRA